MDLALSGGDFVCGKTGRPKTVTGAAELFQRAEIRLTVPLGSFACSPALGSRLHTLTASTPLREQKTLAMAQEALRGLPQLSVTKVECVPSAVKITLNAGGIRRCVEVTL
ncbi:MAG: histidine kinase [Oscillospiraceae bacterium]|jgi:hypothetical protein|nr:histidine kinase [Oscillospiraceae bacterium]